MSDCLLSASAATVRYSLPACTGDGSEYYNEHSERCRSPHCCDRVALIRRRELSIQGGNDEKGYKQWAPIGVVVHAPT